ncbi:MAG: nicotinamide riboside transporter PnuC [Mycoplasmataceae bacterium]|nr:nicotinamide riboside transporter PnuC [Mycoplasmataceae bacterium]
MLNETQSFIKNKIFNGWTKFEVILLSINCAIGLAIMIWGFVDYKLVSEVQWLAYLINVVSFLACVTNAICFILIGKKRVSNYIWGLIAVVLLGGVAFFNENTATWILNWVFYIPTQIAGFFMWRHAQNKKSEIKPRKLKWYIFMCLSIICVGIVVALTYVNSLPDVQKLFYPSNDIISNPSFIDWLRFFADAAVLTVSVFAMIMMILRYVEQLLLWIVADASLIILWVVTLIIEQDVSAIQMVLTWVVTLMIVIYGYINWRKQLVKK